VANAFEVVVMIWVKVAEPASGVVPVPIEWCMDHKRDGYSVHFDEEPAKASELPLSTCYSPVEPFRNRHEHYLYLDAYQTVVAYRAFVCLCDRSLREH
jgi:hypothetical protein